jgi:hypothetical protein
MGFWSHRLPGERDLRDSNFYEWYWTKITPKGEPFYCILSRSYRPLILVFPVIINSLLFLTILCFCFCIKICLPSSTKFLFPHCAYDIFLIHKIINDIYFNFLKPGLLRCNLHAVKALYRWEITTFMTQNIAVTPKSSLMPLYSQPSSSMTGNC